MVLFRGLQVVLVLFNLFLSDLDSAAECTFSKSVGDTNFCDEVSTVKRRDAIQGYLDRLQRWVCTKLMKINKAMGKDIHTGQGSPKHKCKQSGECT